MNDQIIVPNDSINKTDGRTDLSNIFFAPGQSERILDPALDFHHLKQGMIKQLFNSPAQQRVKVPELVNLDQVRVIAGQDEIRIILQE